MTPEEAKAKREALDPISGMAVDLLTMVAEARIEASKQLIVARMIHAMQPDEESQEKLSTAQANESRSEVGFAALLSTMAEVKPEVKP